MAATASLLRLLWRRGPCARAGHRRCAGPPPSRSLRARRHARLDLWTHTILASARRTYAAQGFFETVDSAAHTLFGEPVMGETRSLDLSRDASLLHRGSAVGRGPGHPMALALPDQHMIARRERDRSPVLNAQPQLPSSSSTHSSQSCTIGASSGVDWPAETMLRLMRTPGRRSSSGRSRPRPPAGLPAGWSWSCLPLRSPLKGQGHIHALLFDSPSTPPTSARRAFGTIAMQRGEIRTPAFHAGRHRRHRQGDEACRCAAGADIIRQHLSPDVAPWRRARRSPLVGCIKFMGWDRSILDRFRAVIRVMSLADLDA